MIPTVAIIGHPNVGKSSIFNSLVRCPAPYGAGRGQNAITDKMPGSTRDRIYKDCRWKDRFFRLVDTGGVDLTLRLRSGLTASDRLSAKVKKQIAKAIEEADLILFVCDTKKGILPQDEEIADMLRKADRKVLLVANKSDNEKLIEASVEFYRFGFEQVLPTSATQGEGLKALLDAIAGIVRESGPVSEKKLIKVAIVGRQNVGKSSFLNAVLEEERVIVDEEPGTTRDAIDTYFQKDGLEYLLIDTAGIRHKLKKSAEPADMYGIERSKNAIKRADVALVLIDGFQGILFEDLRIFDLVKKERKPTVIAVNKWDAVDEQISQEQYLSAILKKAPFLNYAPICFVSSKTSMNLDKALDLINLVFSNSFIRIATKNLNQAMGEMQKIHHPSSIGGKRPKLKYIVQTETRPTKFLIFCDKPALLKRDYIAFIENGLRERFKLIGIPITISLREK